MVDPEAFKTFHIHNVHNLAVGVLLEKLIRNHNYIPDCMHTFVMTSEQVKIQLQTSYSKRKICCVYSYSAFPDVKYKCAVRSVP